MDFVVLKVNGRDVSNASHEEAVAAFKSAREPILVEVLRRASSSRPSPCRADAFSQTEDAWRDERSCGFPESVASYQEHDEDAIEYEEVRLVRDGPEKLGLTLCYGDTEVYVGEIEPRSVAAQNGRLQEGDQILQVNGFDVCSRDQAIALFSELRPDFAILVARPRVQEESRWSWLLDEETGAEKDSGKSSDRDAEISVLAREFQRVTLDRKGASVEQWVRHAAFLRKWDDSGSSAYHTGGSSSSPPTLSLSRSAEGPTFRGAAEDKGTQMRHVASSPSCQPLPCRRLPKTPSEPARVQPDDTELAEALYPIMYTNTANLQHTMSLQQHLFREALARRPARHGKGGDQLKSEWKVKERADGTRRAARSKMLRDREQKVLQDRGGSTTDDDNRSELKTGRYWSREERKRHLERARDRKKKEMMLRLKMAIVKEEEGKARARKTPDVLAVTTV